MTSTTESETLLISYSFPMQGTFRPIFDYPGRIDLGMAQDTFFSLQLYFPKQCKQQRDADFSKTICVVVERFSHLSPLGFCLSISLFETKQMAPSPPPPAHELLGDKKFYHDFKNGEKTLTLQMDINRHNDPLNHALKNVVVQGYISVFPPYSKVDRLIENCPKRNHGSFPKLCNDFRRMLEDRSFSDVTFKCGEEDVFAHRSILSARSSVFKAMFESDMKETLSKEVVITDVDAEAFRAVILYLYCGETGDLTCALACHLLYASDKYDVPELKKTCVAFLKTQLSNDNVFRILSAAVLLDEELKLSVFEFIGNNFNVIERMKEWNELKTEQPTMFVDVLVWIAKWKNKN